MISRSTGKGRKNKPVDIVILQLLLNKVNICYLIDPATITSTSVETVTAMTKATKETIRKADANTKVIYRLASSATPQAPIPNEATFLPNLKVDGVSVPALITRIEAYQEAISISKPDGRIDVGGTTIKALLKDAGVNAGTNRMTFIRKAIGHGRTVSMIKPLTVVNLYKKQYYEESYNFSSANMQSLEYILTKAKADPDLSFIPEFAYMLATAKYETYHSFRPVDERGKGAGRRYSKEIIVTHTDASKKTTTYKNKYYGRGYVQLTWGYSYQAFDEILGNGIYPNKLNPNKWNSGFTITKPTESIYLHPAKVKDKELAYSIMVKGMQNGTYTQQHKIGAFVNKSKIDYLGARWVINKQDKVKLFAGYAENFEVLLLISAGN